MRIGRRAPDIAAGSVSSTRELSSRVSSGIRVRLLWSQADGRLWVSVFDHATGEAFRIAVRESERPLDVFDHPYAYAAHHAIGTHAPGAGSS
jgi:hypothetical protein